MYTALLRDRLDTVGRVPGLDLYGMESGVYEFTPWVRVCG